MSKEPVMYDYHEKGKAPDLESILADFMTYQASSKGYQWESYRQSDYHNKAEGVLNLDDLLMQFKDIVESIQQAFRRTETQISKLVDDMTNAAARKEEERRPELEAGAGLRARDEFLSDCEILEMKETSSPLVN
ncbi:hypothetical protein GmHk_12G035216 [Glycine max]|nr:hypothetical protein GmHk_12G035216 [Glycine max]